MATRIELTQIIPTGVEYKFTPIVQGETYLFRNTGRSHVAIRNDGDSVAQVRFYTIRQHEELHVEDRTIGIAPGKNKATGPFLMSVFNPPDHDIRFELISGNDVRVLIVEP